MNSLPETLWFPVSRLLLEIGDATDILSTKLLGGGCISNASRLETGKGVYFLKWNTNQAPGIFQSEVHGLQLLKETQTVLVPKILGFSDQVNMTPAFLLLEWLEGKKSGDQGILGEQLAELHRSSAPGNPMPFYGLDQNNYIGATRQVNQPKQDWGDFFVECRLKPQISLARKQGRLGFAREQRVQQLLGQIPDLLQGFATFPSLIHGDLWIGNVINSPQGLALIDPAVSYSDREAEIAYTELFGGFGDRFYAAYQSVWPLDPGYPERRDLYNLYHLLNHLNLFGESYGYQVDLILRRYTSG